MSNLEDIYQKLKQVQEEKDSPEFTIHKLAENTDVLKVIPTPRNGLVGSTQSLQISTLRSGIPGRNTNDVQQDDLIMNINNRIGTTIRAEELPNCVVRVFLPEASLWENRTGPHFGIRLGVRTTAEKPREGLFAIGTQMKTEPYWPGIWVHFKSETNRGVGAYGVSASLEFIWKPDQR